ncbi:MAG: hypothetical protein HN542_04105 [Flavobacteriales bacterium]|jgi:hypothetical protein|nr:hypothetical protein [Flavobacteriales bacterium]NCG31127.1 hypothetical protein [Bacteroidota bacterium]MBT3962513.1 hypothetical protein [Flavobacteriales bacterium]MBT4706030.1 hypothetical protein [Flavobacteriales bacterium]MBT4931448.1 hypothetical protein [Flavobacteriales bacterium]
MNDNHPNLCFHLGLEKTGSTFLQLTVFQNLEGVSYHRKSRFKLFEKIVADYPEANHLFTFETDRELFPSIDKIVKTRPDAKVILILRRQDSWLSSKYYYHIRKHGFKTLKEFFNLETGEGEWEKEEFLLRPKIEYLESHFTTPILFLNYDELKKSPEQYVQLILDYCGAKLKPGVDLHKRRKRAFSVKQNRVLMAFNKLYKYEHLGSKSRFWNKLWYKYREFLLHIVAFLAQFVPGFLVSDEALVDKDYLEQVKAHYQEDWEFALSRVTSISTLS